MRHYVVQIFCSDIALKRLMIASIGVAPKLVVSGESWEAQFVGGEEVSATPWDDSDRAIDQPLVQVAPKPYEPNRGDKYRVPIRRCEHRFTLAS